MSKLLESVNAKFGKDLETRRYNLSSLISEGYSALYQCENNTNLYKVVESHLEDVRNHPQDIERLSRQFCAIKESIKLVESGHMDDSDFLPADPTPRRRKIKKTESNVPKRRPVKSTRPVRSELEEDLDHPQLTEEELDELTKHLEELRKDKSAAEEPAKKEVKESEASPRRFRRKSMQEKKGCKECDDVKVKESKSYSSLDLKEFSQKSSSKAFMRTFKKLQDKLKEGVALTRQESIDLYKAANSAMTQLSIELEHNPDFLATFTESVELLSTDVNKMLHALKESKAPSKATMKSLAEFSEALLYEADEDKEDEEEIEVDIDDVEETPEEDIPDEDFVGDDEGDLISEEAEEFLQDYADARQELHDELASQYEDSEDPDVQSLIDRDAEEIAFITGEDPEEEIEGDPEEGIPEDEESEVDDLEDITDDEYEELKNHLKEMRSLKKKKSLKIKEGNSH